MDGNDLVPIIILGVAVLAIVLASFAVRKNRAAPKPYVGIVHTDPKDATDPSRPAAAHSPDVANPPNPYRSPRRLAAPLVGLLIFLMVFQVLATFADLDLLRFLTRAKNGEFVSFGEATSVDTRMRVLGVIQIVTILVSAILFFIWFRRCYRNLRALGVKTLRFSEGWALGAWFVPILSLFRPKQIADDIWRASDAELPPTFQSPEDAGRVSPLVHAWWAVFLVTVVLARALRIPDTETLDGMIQLTRWALVSDAVEILDAALSMLVVRGITYRQELRYQRLQQGITAQPAEV